MTTDDDRAKAREKANERFAFHREDPNYDPNYGINTIDCREGSYRSNLCEIEFGKRFGLQPDFTLRRHGDGGIDFPLTLLTRFGPMTFPVNVKAHTCKRDWSYIRTITKLLVPVNGCRRHTIYVYGVYHLGTDEAEVLGWQWGSALIKRNEVIVIHKINYAYPLVMLRGLEELEQGRVDKLSHPEVPMEPGFGLSV